MVPTSWCVREGGGAMALMPWCYAARNGLVRLVVRASGSSSPCFQLLRMSHVMTRYWLTWPRETRRTLAGRPGVQSE